MTDTPDINALSEVAVPVTYTNWRGETKRIRLILSGGLRFGTTDWHDQPTWLFSGFDVDHPAQIWKEYDLTKTVFDAGQLFTAADVEAAVKAEREACAQLVASSVSTILGRSALSAVDRLAKAIRARGDST